MTSSPTHYHFVTGRLAESSVRKVVGELAVQAGWQHSISVLPITVAALMNSSWLLKRLEIPDEATELILPGYLETEQEKIAQAINIPVRCGPKNIWDLPQFFGKPYQPAEDYGRYSIQILAEINHADRLPLERLIQQADELRQDGADLIDLGCSPDNCWTSIGVAVRELIDRGLSVSVDSFNSDEVIAACSAGASLVLSVNSLNCHLAKDWGAEVVAIPDTPNDLCSLDHTIELLQRDNVPFRIDPILEPIGVGLANSLLRYADCRCRYPSVPMMMGIGNVTELTDADSAGINTLLLGICQELKIESVLTTQVIHWARNSVRECDLARRLVHYAVENGIPPKHLQPNLVTLRPTAPLNYSEDQITQLASAIRDNNFRIMANQNQIHALSAGIHFCGDDPFQVMQQILDSPLGRQLDAAHAFYLGFEMCKAYQALLLSKRYEQDEPLNWGYLTRPERHWRLSTRHANSKHQ